MNFSFWVNEEGENSSIPPLWVVGVAMNPEIDESEELCAAVKKCKVMPFFVDCKSGIKDRRDIERVNSGDIS